MLEERLIPYTKKSKSGKEYTHYKKVLVDPVKEKEYLDRKKKQDVIFGNKVIQHAQNNAQKENKVQD